MYFEYFAYFTGGGGRSTTIPRWIPRPQSLAQCQPIASMQCRCLQWFAEGKTGQHNQRFALPVPHNSTQNDPALRLVVRALMVSDEPVSRNSGFKRHEIVRVTTHILSQTFESCHLITEAPPLQSCRRSEAQFVRRGCGRRYGRSSHRNPTRAKRQTEKEPMLPYSHAISLRDLPIPRHTPNGSCGTLEEPNAPWAATD
jgi:hypothetical protein